jgi:hypothetical protein
MKIQCTCGAKVAFDVTPDMAGRTLQFVCPSCGLDSSAFVNQLIRQELMGVPSSVPPGQAILVPAAAPQPQPTAPRPATVPAPAPISPGAPKISIPAAPAVQAPAPIRVTPTAPQPVSVPAPTAPPPPAPVAAPTPITPRPVAAPVARVAGTPASLVPAVPSTAAPALSISGKAAASVPEGTTPAEGDEGPRCSKHPNVVATAKCYVCSKPICPKCMELFGYLCSPLCKAKADSNGIKVPVFAGQKSVMERKLWRKVGIVAYSVLGLFLLWLGLWFWYAWFGSRPAVAFTVHFEEPAFSGQSAMLGADSMVFLHGGQLARYDTKQKKQIWSHQLVDPKKVEEDSKLAIKKMEDMVNNSEMSAHDNPIRIPSLERMKIRVQRAYEADMKLKVQGDGLWIMTSKKLIRFDKSTGLPDKEIELPKDSYGRFIPRGDELLQVQSDFAGNENITHINLNTCETRVENVRKVVPLSTNDDTKLLAKAMKGAGKSGSKGLAGLPTKPGQNVGKPMDPRKVEEEASHLSLPERIALPVTIANARNQQRALDEAKDPEDSLRRAGPRDPEEDFRTILTKDGYVRLAVKMTEEHHTERVAMKPKPASGKSVLDGNVTASRSLELANEMLNEMQRDAGGATVQEDESKYRVTFKRADDPNPWTGEVIGRPQLFPLNTVDVLSSNKKIMVFDKTHKKLWEAALTYNVEGRGMLGGLDDDEEDTKGEGPCVERKGVLYVADAGVLTAFDLATGNVRWRVPTVGVSGMFFDDKDGMYVNTTTATPEMLKYNREIDVSRKNAGIVMKIDAKSGKALWAAQPGGRVVYVSGKFVYTLESYSPYEDDETTFEAKTGFETPPFLRVKRLNPKSGRQMWEYSRSKAPYDIEFDKNSIRLVLKNEVTLLKFFTL